MCQSRSFRPKPQTNSTALDQFMLGLLVSSGSTASAVEIVADTPKCAIPPPPKQQRRIFQRRASMGSFPSNNKWDRIQHIRDKSCSPLSLPKRQGLSPVSPEPRRISSIHSSDALFEVTDVLIEVSDKVEVPREKLLDRAAKCPQRKTLARMARCSSMDEDIDFSGILEPIEDIIGSKRKALNEQYKQDLKTIAQEPEAAEEKNDRWSTPKGTFGSKHKNLMTSASQPIPLPVVLMQHRFRPSLLGTARWSH